MKAEWTYLAPEVAPLDLPIADKIWKHLPRRIDDKIIAVNFFPQLPVILLGPSRSIGHMAYAMEGNPLPSLNPSSLVKVGIDPNPLVSWKGVSPSK